MRRLIPTLSRRPGSWGRTTTRGALVFLLAGGLGMAALAARAPALASLLDSAEASEPAASMETTAPEIGPETGSETVLEAPGPTKTDRVLADQGVVLRQITVVGRVNSDPADLLEAVGLERGEPLMAADPTKVRDRLLALPWVAEARVERRLPDRLHLDIVEREPMALWQHAGQYAVIDRAGKPVNVDPGAWASLPLVVGKGAPERAANLLNLLTTQPALAARVKAATLVGERRWTLRLDHITHGVILRLPAHDAAEALAQVAALDSQQGLLSRDLALIDMRLPGRMVVRTVNREETEDDTRPDGTGTSGSRPAGQGPQPRAGGRDA